MTDNANGKIGIVELSSIVNRRPATIRNWERRGIMPQELLPQRDDRGWRWWTSEQARGIVAWILQERMWPGKGLPHYKPDQERVAAHVEKMRRSA